MLIVFVKWNARALIELGKFFLVFFLIYEWEKLKNLIENTDISVADLKVNFETKEKKGTREILHMEHHTWYNHTM